MQNRLPVDKRGAKRTILKTSWRTDQTNTLQRHAQRHQRATGITPTSGLPWKCHHQTRWTAKSVRACMCVLELACPVSDHALKLGWYTVALSSCFSLKLPDITANTTYTHTHELTLHASHDLTLRFQHWVKMWESFQKQYFLLPVWSVLLPIAFYRNL